MEEVRQLVQEEGREARNLVAFHVAVDTPARISRKPPRSLGGPAAVRRAPPRPARRSASAGRDKRSELRARYWALLFGDLQRAIGEIYNTVEAHENLNECQEVILVLENYTRDFKALGEWFRLKWEYDNTPPPQRPQSLAWEIRKTDFVRPESRRAYSVKSSPSVSGKNSPCLSGHNTPSGKNSPNLTGKASPGSGKISPRISSGHSSTSPKANIEFFSSKISASKVTAKPEPKLAKEASRLSDITEKDVKECSEENHPSEKEDVKQEVKVTPIVELGKAKEHPNVSPKQVVIKSPKRAVNQDSPKSSKLSNESSKASTDPNSTHAKAINSKLDVMENEFLVKQLSENKVKNDNMLNHDIEIENASKTRDTNNSEVDKSDINVEDEAKEPSVVVDIAQNSLAETDSPTKSEDNFADVSNESSSKSSDGRTLDTSASVDDKIETNKEPKVQSAEPDSVLTEDVKTEVKETGTASVESPKTIDNNAATCDNSKSEKTAESIEQNDSDTTSKVEQNGSVDSKDELKKEAEKKDKVVEPKVSARPAYSQAAAKPKPVTVSKTEVKTPTKTTALIRSKTVVEIRPASAPKTQRQQFPKKNQVNKCSYPFNLTTGRKSLFDSPTATNKNVLPRKPLSKNVQLASGDAKASQNKIDMKKRPPRPTTLKVNDKDSKKESLNSTLEKIKDYDDYGSSDTIVTQIDMSRIESTESLKTLVPEELQMIDDIANSIEVLNVDSNKSDNDGWLTVKSRRLSRESKKQSKSHWAQRFHQPSATTSLPTLNMIESPKQESKPIVDSPKNAKLDRAKSEQPQPMKPEKMVKVSETVKPESKVKDLAMIRQKSDVTGLKTRSSRSKALTKKTEKAKDDESKDEESAELTKNRLHSSLESLTTGLARSQESTEEAFDFDKWKAEFKSTFKYFDDDDQILNHTDILETADPSERSEIAEMTSQIEENEKKLGWALDFQSEVDQRKLCEEEDLLNRQIMELQQVSDIDLDTETDDTETDAEILCEEALCRVEAATGTLSASLEDRYETALAGMSWAERVDTLGALEALVARDPGRAQQLHAKLSQGIKRRGSLQDALRRLQAKQARAERQRIEYQTERAKKIHQLLAKVEEVKVAKNQLIEEKRLRMEKRLQKAAENRDQHLKDIVRKAHDEEEKLREIAFIKQLEAENRRHEFLDQCRSHTTRLRHVRRERLTKLEQKAAREAAVNARRLALEAARKTRVEALVERRRQRDAARDTLDQLKRHERHQAAKEKAEGVKSRLSALAAAAELEADALRSRIRDKQDASQQRLESHLQAIREKATTGPRQATTSESQDAVAREEREMAEASERERRDRERQKAIKKRARKVRQRLLANGLECSAPEECVPIPFEPVMLPATSKLHKVIHNLSNIITPLYYDRPDTNGVDDKKKKEDTERRRKKNGEGVESNNNNGDELDEGEGSNGARRKKKKDAKARLSKANSVCSSLSDMSRGSSGKGERSRVAIDVTVLERQLNELNRLIDKTENTTEKVVYQKVQGMRLLGQLLTVAAEREDLASQLTTRVLRTAVTGAARGAAACPVSAALLLASNTCVRLVQLLADRLVSTGVRRRALLLASNTCVRLVQLLADRLVSTGVRRRALLLASNTCVRLVQLLADRLVSTGVRRRALLLASNTCVRLVQLLADRLVSTGVRRRALLLASNTCVRLVQLLADRLVSTGVRRRALLLASNTCVRLVQLLADRLVSTGVRRRALLLASNTCVRLVQLLADRLVSTGVRRRALLLASNTCVRLVQLLADRLVSTGVRRRALLLASNTCVRLVQLLADRLVSTGVRRRALLLASNTCVRLVQLLADRLVSTGVRRRALLLASNTCVRLVQLLADRLVSTGVRRRALLLASNTCVRLVQLLADRLVSTGVRRRALLLASNTCVRLVQLLADRLVSTGVRRRALLLASNTCVRLVQLLADRLVSTGVRRRALLLASNTCVRLVQLLADRLVSTGVRRHALLLASNTCVRLMQLLADRLDKDMSDPKEVDLAKQLSDCLSVTLDAVLCSTRVYEGGDGAGAAALSQRNHILLGPRPNENGETVEDNKAMLSMLRSRAHTLISYLCLSGCIARAEKAGEARESIQTLLTVCADLCQPCDADVGSERQSATQSLRCALGTGVCGSRAEFCVLFARGAQLGEKEGSGGFVRAARTAHLLRALAELDYHIVQEAFGEAGWPLEFRAAVARLLSQHAPNDKEAPRTTSLRLCNQRLDQTLSETMVLDLIVLVGFVVVNNPQLQETILEGWSVVKTLCTLPANWLVSRPHCAALLPTLAALAQRPSVAAAIAAELSLEMIEEFMESPEAQDVKLVQVIKQGRGKKTSKK